MSRKSSWHTCRTCRQDRLRNRPRWNRKHLHNILANAIEAIIVRVVPPAQCPDHEQEPLVGEEPIVVVVKVVGDDPPPIKPRFFASAFTRRSPMERRVLKLVM